MNKNLFLGFLICIFFFGKLSAQNTVLTGVVIEKQKQLPVEFASVSVLKATDSAIVAGALTNNKGVFTIPNMDRGNYILRVISLGYQTRFRTFSVVQKGQQAASSSWQSAA